MDHPSRRISIASGGFFLPLVVVMIALRHQFLSPRYGAAAADVTNDLIGGEGGAANRDESMGVKVRALARRVGGGGNHSSKFV